LVIFSDIFAQKTLFAAQIVGKFNDLTRSFRLNSDQDSELVEIRCRVKVGVLEICSQNRRKRWNGQGQLTQNTDGSFLADGTHRLNQNFDHCLCQNYPR